MTMSTGQSEGRRSEMSRSESNCLRVGTNLNWFAWRWASVAAMGCESMDCVLHGDSSQAGRINTTRSELGDVVSKCV